MEVSALKYHGHAGTGLHGRSPLLRLQSDERLIALLRRGNTAAFEVLVSRYESRLLAFCRHLLGSREDAEDVLQEVMTAAFNAIVADERPINVRPWLYRIARNRSLNHLRRTQAIAVDTMDFQLSEHGATTADKVHEREEFRLLVGDIHELPETQKTALVLREMDAMSYEQIAEAMETTVSSVKSLLVRARLSLAEAAEARALSCEEVRIELAEIAEGLLKRPSPLVKRHLKACDRCSAFRSAAQAHQQGAGGAAPGRAAGRRQEVRVHPLRPLGDDRGRHRAGDRRRRRHRGGRRRRRCAGRRGRVLGRQRVHRRGDRRRRDQGGRGAGGRGAGDRRSGRGQQLGRRAPPSRASRRRARSRRSTPPPAASSSAGTPPAAAPTVPYSESPSTVVTAHAGPFRDRRDRQARRQDEADPDDPDRPDDLDRDRPDRDDPGRTPVATTPDDTTTGTDDGSRADLDRDLALGPGDDDRDDRPAAGGPAADDDDAPTIVTTTDPTTPSRPRRRSSRPPTPTTTAAPPTTTTAVDDDDHGRDRATGAAGHDARRSRSDLVGADRHRRRPRRRRARSRPRRRSTVGPVARLIDFDQFLAVDMRVGRVTAVDDFPEARKPAWKLTIDFGAETRRQALVGADHPLRA